MAEKDGWRSTVLMSRATHSMMINRLQGLNSQLFSLPYTISDWSQWSAKNRAPFRQFFNKIFQLEETIADRKSVRFNQRCSPFRLECSLIREFSNVSWNRTLVLFVYLSYQISFVKRRKSSMKMWGEISIILDSLITRKEI